MKKLWRKTLWLLCKRPLLALPILAATSINFELFWLRNRVILEISETTYSVIAGRMEGGPSTAYLDPKFVLLRGLLRYGTEYLILLVAAISLLVTAAMVVRYLAQLENDSRPTFNLRRILPSLLFVSLLAMLLNIGTNIFFTYGDNTSHIYLDQGLKNNFGQMYYRDSALYYYATWLFSKLIVAFFLIPPTLRMLIRCIGGVAKGIPIERGRIAAFITLPVILLLLVVVPGPSFEGSVSNIPMSFLLLKLAHNLVVALPYAPLFIALTLLCLPRARESSITRA